MLFKRNRNLIKAQRAFSPTRVLLLGFAVLILVGTWVLTLPVSSADGQGLAFVDAFFTAASCVCVTGLAVVSTATAFSMFGKCVLLVLIQAGGIGFMTLATMVFMILGRKITLRDRLVMKESLNEEGITGLVRLTLRIVRLVFIIEAAGALLLSLRFVPMYGVGRGLFYSVFHSISAFCNAGFDLLGGFTNPAVASDPYILCVIMALIVVGGLGYTVIFDVLKTRNFRGMMLHSKIVLLATAFLIVSGFVLFAALEWNNPDTLASPAFMGAAKPVSALFHSITLRTAGFSTIDLNHLRPASKILSMLYMFVGASPASTGGGIKTTTACLIFLFAAMAVRGKDEITLFKRRISHRHASRAVAIGIIAFAVTGLGALFIIEQNMGAAELMSFENLLFEAVSAIGTVGLSMGVTPDLAGASKYVLVLMMFVGRVGPMTVAAALTRQNGSESKQRYPRGRIMIG